MQKFPSNTNVDVYDLATHVNVTDKYSVAFSCTLLVVYQLVFFFKFLNHKANASETFVHGLRDS